MYRITHLCRIAVCVMFAPLPLCAQRAGATVRATGQVSAVVAVSATSAPRVLKGQAQVSAGGVGTHTLVLSLSGAGGGETQVDIPVQLRSNVGFTLAASCATSGATLSGLSVVGVDGTGKFVYPEAAGRVEVAAAFDGRRGPHPLGGQDWSSPVAVLSGPPISMSGTLASPGNMIEVVLRVVVSAPAGGEGWRAELKFSAAGRQQGWSAPGSVAKGVTLE